MLDELCPECGKQLQRRVGRFGPFVGCSGYPDCRYIKKDPPRSLEIPCPQCNQGEIVEKRTRFGVFFGCDRYPECDFAVNNEPLKEPRCPEDGSLLLQRPKSIRCWGCGAEFDLDMNLTKPGDPEAEAEARAAKSAARAARAAAKAAKKTDDEEEGDDQEEAGREEEAGRPEEDRREEEARGEEGPGTDAGRIDGRALGGPVGVVDHGRGRRTPRHSSGHPQGSPDPPDVRAAARGDDRLVVRRLGGVRGRDGDRLQPRAAASAIARHLGRDARAHVARLPLRSDRGHVHRPARPQADHDRRRHRPRPCCTSRWRSSASCGRSTCCRS